MFYPKLKRVVPFEDRVKVFHYRLTIIGGYNEDECAGLRAGLLVSTSLIKDAMLLTLDGPEIWG